MPTDFDAEFLAARRRKQSRIGVEELAILCVWMGLATVLGVLILLFGLDAKTAQLIIMAG